MEQQRLLCKVKWDDGGQITVQPEVEVRGRERLKDAMESVQSSITATLFHWPSYR